MGAPTFGQALGRLVLSKRKALGLTQTQLAEDAFGTAKKTRRVHEIETGTVANPHPKTIDPIIATLQISQSEIEECARTALARGTSDLDKAFIEARQMIESIAQEFESTNKDATLSELNDFLLGKAREWRTLKARIEEIEDDKGTLSNLRSAAISALNEGKFGEIDSLLAEAEEIQQFDHTLVEVAKQAEIRILRGDAHFLAGHKDAALDAYLAASSFFEPFDIKRSVQSLQETSARLYETIRRSVERQYLVPMRLTEKAISLANTIDDAQALVELNYQLSLLYRNEHASSVRTRDSSLLDRAIASARIAVKGYLNDAAMLACAKYQLANCLQDKAKILEDSDSNECAINVFRDVIEHIGRTEECSSLLAGVYSNLGGALFYRWKTFTFGGEEAAKLLGEAQRAVESAIACCSTKNDLEVWAAATMNRGSILSVRATLHKKEPSVAYFINIQAIASFLAALEIYQSQTLPHEFADTNFLLSNTLLNTAFCCDQHLVELYLIRAIQHCEASVIFFEEDTHPERWAEVQYQLARIYAIHANLEGVDTAQSDLECAREHLKKSLQALEKVGSDEGRRRCADAITKVEQQLSSLRTKAY